MNSENGASLQKFRSVRFFGAPPLVSKPVVPFIYPSQRWEVMGGTLYGMSVLLKGVNMKRIYSHLCMCFVAVNSCDRERNHNECLAPTHPSLLPPSSLHHTYTLHPSTHTRPAPNPNPTSLEPYKNLTRRTFVYRCEYGTQRAAAV